MRTAHLHHPASFSRVLLLAGAAAAMVVAGNQAGAVTTGDQTPCTQGAGVLHRSSLVGARSDFMLAIAKANTNADPADRMEAIAEAHDELDEALELADEQLAARLDVCEALDEDRYDPEIDPRNFLSAEEIAANPNPYWPMIPGTTYIYEGKTEEGLEVIEVTITDETREILGVECIVVIDRVFIDDELREDTADWYAQDVDGNVWYFGELTFEWEDGEIVGLEGSWESGEDGAKPGIIAFAKPKIGVTYRQEMLLAEAEDVGEILALDEHVEVPYGVFDGCLKTADYTPLEPDVVENKYYALGVGFVLEIKLDSDEVVELVDIIKR